MRVDAGARSMALNLFEQVDCQSGVSSAQAAPERAVTGCPDVLNKFHAAARGDTNTVHSDLLAAATVMRAAPEQRVTSVPEQLVPVESKATALVEEKHHDREFSNLEKIASKKIVDMPMAGQASFVDGDPHLCGHAEANGFDGQAQATSSTLSLPSFVSFHDFQHACFTQLHPSASKKLWDREAPVPSPCPSQEAPVPSFRPFQDGFDEEAPVPFVLEEEAPVPSRPWTNPRMPTPRMLTCESSVQAHEFGKLGRFGKLDQFGAFGEFGRTCPKPPEAFWEPVPDDVQGISVVHEPKQIPKNDQQLVREHHEDEQMAPEHLLHPRKIFGEVCEHGDHDYGPQKNFGELWHHQEHDFASIWKEENCHLTIGSRPNTSSPLKPSSVLKTMNVDPCPLGRSSTHADDVLENCSDDGDQRVDLHLLEEKLQPPS